MKTKLLANIARKINPQNPRARIWTGEKSFTGKIDFIFESGLVAPLPSKSQDYLVRIIDEHGTYYIDPRHISAISVI